MNDVRQIKLFVYCREVVARDGPLWCVSASESERVRRILRYRYAGSRYRVSDEEMNLHAPLAQEEICGPEGTAILADTSRCFHRGSRIRVADAFRAVAVLKYVTTASFELPVRFWRERLPFQRLGRSAARAIDRQVLGADP